jgi:putative glycosyltransferase (TIGR04348 family)
MPRIFVITPAPAGCHNGNRATAERWASRFWELGCDTKIAQSWHGDPTDVLVALHATRSADSIARFHTERAGAPIVVALTGTDLYVDLPESADALRSIELATRLVTLQPLAVARVPAAHRSKVRVIYQSAEPLSRAARNGHDGFQVCLLAHLRPVKDPLRTALAVRALPRESRISIVHAGAPLDSTLAEQARREQRVNPRYRWLGDVPPLDARQLLAESQLLAVTSLSEGGANVVTEAIASGVPIISSRIAGSIGLLGEDYPGYYPVGDTAALGALLQRVEGDTQFREQLRQRCVALTPITRADRERDSWGRLLRELGYDGSSVNRVHSAVPSRGKTDA